MGILPSSHSLAKNLLRVFRKGRGAFVDRRVNPPATERKDLLQRQEPHSLGVVRRKEILLTRDELQRTGRTYSHQRMATILKVDSFRSGPLNDSQIAKIDNVVCTIGSFALCQDFLTSFS